MAERKRKWQPLIFGVICIGVLVLLGLVVKSFMGKTDAPKKPPKISLIPTTPPPPPPPPKEEKRPEPPKEQKEVKMEQVEQKIAPPNPELKMEGQAGDAPSLFASGSVKNDYAGQVLGGGGGFGPYISRLQRHLQEQLNRNRKLRESDYRVTLSVWLDRDGKIQRTELTQSTGHQAVDDLLKQTLLQLTTMSDPPPENFPQPIRIRVTARGAG